ncbi:MAG: hypothetical protein AAFR16_01150 [Pseudomonadota bacterium]
MMSWDSVWQLLVGLGLMMLAAGAVLDGLEDMALEARVAALEAAQ